MNCVENENCNNLQYKNWKIFWQREVSYLKGNLVLFDHSSGQKSWINDSTIINFTNSKIVMQIDNMCVDDNIVYVLFYIIGTI